MEQKPKLMTPFDMLVTSSSLYTLKLMQTMNSDSGWGKWFLPMDFMKVESRKVLDSRVETVHIVRPNHLNAAGRLFGGMLMQWIDEVAALVAKRHTHTNVTTASVDNLSFLKGAYPGDSVVIIGQLVYVGRTSMDIKVDSYVESMDGTRTLINHAYLTVVALNQNDHPIPVPRLEPTTEDEPQNGRGKTTQRT